MVRHPIERIVSQYTHDRLRGWTQAPPETEVLENPLYVNRSRYAMQIAPYLELFGRERILVLIFEELVENIDESLDRVAAFLGLERSGFERVDRSARNASLVKGHRRRFLGLEAAVSLLQRAPAVVQDSARWLARGPGARIFYRRAKERAVFPPELRRELWGRLETDVGEFEKILGRSLDMFREPPPTGWGVR